MAAPLPTQLNWVHGPDVAGNYLAGAQVGMEQQRLQAQMAEFQQRQQMEQQQLGMEQQKLGMMADENRMKHLEAQQSLAIEKSYRDMQLAAQKRQLDMAGQLMTQRTQAAARQGAAMMEWDQFNKILDATPGMDDAAKDSARRSKLFQLAPSLSEGHMAGLSQMLKPQATLPQWMPPNQQSGAPGYFLDTSGKPHFPPKTATTSDAGKFLDTGEASRLRTEISKLEDEIGTGAFKDKKMLASAQARMDDKKRSLNALDKRYNHPLEHPEVEESAPSGKLKIVRDPSGRLVLSGGGTTTTNAPLARPIPPPAPAPAPRSAPPPVPVPPPYPNLFNNPMPQSVTPQRAEIPKVELPPKPRKEYKYPPAPENKEDRVPGKTYMTEQGPMLWYYDKSSKKYKWMVDFGVMLHMVPGLKYTDQPKVQLSDI